MAVAAVDRMQRVAPRASVVTASRAYEHGRLADQRALALDGWAENLADPDQALAHAAIPIGRYSAQVFGVSLTRTAEVSGQCCLHQL